MTDKKPIAPLIGANGNIFNLLAIARQCLVSHDKKSEAEEMQTRVFASKSYDEALAIIGEYVVFGVAEI